MALTKLTPTTNDCSTTLTDVGGIAKLYFNKVVNMHQSTPLTFGTADIITAITIAGLGGEFVEFPFQFDSKKRTAKLKTTESTENGRLTCKSEIEFGVNGMNATQRDALVTFMNQCACGVVCVAIMLNGQIEIIGVEKTALLANPVFPDGAEHDRGVMTTDSNNKTIKLVCNGSTPPYYLTNLAVLTAVL